MDRQRHQTTDPQAAQPDAVQIADGLVRVVLALIIIELTAATASIHLDLGGALFTINGIGYLALGAAYATGALVPLAIPQRFAWLPRIGLIGYASTTIVAYLVMGPYFTLGWTAKGIEAAIIGLLVAEMVIVYGSPRGVWRAAAGSFSSTRRPHGPRRA